MKRLAIPLLTILLAAPLTATELRREVQASPGERLTVELFGGSIEITGSNRGSVLVEATIGGRDAEEAGIQVRRTARGVEIVQEHQRRSHRSRIDLRVQVPRRFDLDLQTLGGTIGISNVQGTLEGQTMGGNLNLSALEGTLDMTTHGGNIVLRDATVDGEVKTMGGQVLLENVRGDVKGTSMGGNVVYRNVTTRDGRSTGKAARITTMGGAIDVEDAPEGAELSTMGGNVHVGKARRYVKAKTMGGRIDIDAVDGWVEATTMGGHVAVTMVGNPAQGDRHVEIDSKGGDIDLTVPPGLEMDIDVQIAFTRDSRRQYSIRSDFPIQTTTSPEWETSHGTPRRIIQGRGRTGSGKHKVVIRTINGDVKIRRGH